ncbi:MAG: hypothetical protein AAGD11_11605 [Planctomycetota bacterium]
MPTLTGVATTICDIWDMCSQGVARRLLSKKTSLPTAGSTGNSRLRAD